MTPLFYAGLLAALGFVAFVFGVWLGAKSERNAWVSRAMPTNDRAHYCDGEFYYIIPENLYCKMCQVRHVLEEERRAASAPKSVVAELPQCEAKA